MDIVKKTIRSFDGIPHRLELVRELDGVKYYNDTAATSPDGAIFGIQSFIEPIVLIAGGSDKNLDMAELARVISKRIKKIVFLKGRGTEKIIASLRELGWQENPLIVDSMDAAVMYARKLATNGEVVLLSPGAASFGLFLNEFDRGDKFRDIVNNLK
jgi:UDP-N-acetylmuramoylalanine--D-glutamate ligase